MTRTDAALLGFFWSNIGMAIAAHAPAGPRQYCGFIYMIGGSILLSAAAISKLIPGEGK